MNILFLSVAFVTGILASLGLGGGMILILYMTLIAGMNQLTSQGINLLFFIPIAFAALILHTRNRLVRWKKIIPAIICGCITAVAGTFIARSVGNEYMTTIFSVFVLITGIRELFSKSDN